MASIEKENDLKHCSTSSDNLETAEQSADFIGSGKRRKITRTKLKKEIVQRRRYAKKLEDVSKTEIINSVLELAYVSVADFLDENGEINLSEIKKAGGGRFIKDFTMTETKKKNGDIDRKYSFKGYSRLDALKTLNQMIGTKEDENREKERFKIACRLAMYMKAKDPRQDLDEIIENVAFARSIDLDRLKAGVLSEIKNADENKVVMPRLLNPISESVLWNDSKEK